MHPHHAFVNEDFVRIAHDAGLAVNTWTCDEPERIRWLADLGVDAVITNIPDVALHALGRSACEADSAAATGITRSRTSGSWLISRSSVSPRWSPSTWYGNGP